MKFNNGWHYILLVAVFCLFTYFFNAYLQTDRVIITSLQGKYSQKIISNYLQQKKEWEWLSYVSVPIIILIRTSLVAFFMQLVVMFQYMGNDEDELPSFGKYWSVTLFAEWIMLLTLVVKFVWFIVVEPNYTLEELQSFTSLSLANVINTKEMDPWLAYPISLVNVWELLFWFLLVMGVKEIFEKTEFPKNWLQSFWVVLSSYGVAMFIWIIFVMYLILNLTS